MKPRSGVAGLSQAAVTRPVTLSGRGLGNVSPMRMQRHAAELGLVAFASRVSRPVDLDALERELVGVVNDTMQPAHASVWLRSAR